ncbi:MAG: hypothetical protein WDO73_29425 [Ignavibacteriota bacterium]
MEALRKGGGKTTGRLYTELNPEGSITRNDFEDVLGAMARAGLVRLTSEVFEKDGKSIPYRKANLLDDREEFEILMKEEVTGAPPGPENARRKLRSEPRSGAPGKRSERGPHPMRASRLRYGIGG